MQQLKKFQFELWLLMLILVLGAVIRFYQLGRVPASLYWDETAIWVDAAEIIKTGRDVHGQPWYQPLFASYGDFKLPGYIWLVATSFAVMGEHEWVVRLPNAVAGIAQIWLIYQLAIILIPSIHKWKSARWYGLMSAVIIATAPWAILFSRTGFEGYLGQFLLTLSIWVLLKKPKSKISLIISSLIAGLAVYTYFSTRYVWPVVFLAAQVLLISRAELDNKTNLYQQLKIGVINVFIGLIVWSITLLPMLSSPNYQASQIIRLSTASILNDQSLITQAATYRQMLSGQVWTRVIFNQEILQIRQLLINLGDHLDFSYLFNHGDTNLRHSTTRSGLLLMAMMPLLLLGVIKWITDDWRGLTFLAIWWLIALVPASVPYNTPHALRSLNALTPLILICGYGGYIFWRRCEIFWRVIQATWLAWLIWGFGFFMIDYFYLYPARSASEWQSGYAELAKFLVTNSHNYERIYVDAGDDRFYLWYIAYRSVAIGTETSVDRSNYTVRRIGNIYFETVSDENLFPPPQDKLYVTTVRSVNRQPRQIISDSFATPKFAIW